MSTTTVKFEPTHEISYKKIKKTAGPDPEPIGHESVLSGETKE